MSMVAYPRTTTAPDIRHAYVRGVLEACADAKVTAEVTASVCKDLAIASEELAILVNEAYTKKENL